MKNSKKYAFSFAEMAVIMFIIIALTCLFFGKVFVVKQEKNTIYEWKYHLANIQYAYKVMLLTKPDLLDKFVAEVKNRNVNILGLLKINVNIENISNTSIKYPLKYYKYRYMNGMPVEPESKYYVKDFAYANGVIVGLNWVNSDCKTDKKLCGVMILDTNANKPPNRFGVDIFGVDIFYNEVLPFGHDLSYEENMRGCQRLEQGVTCSQYYLSGGQFN